MENVTESSRYIVPNVRICPANKPNDNPIYLMLMAIYSIRANTAPQLWLKYIRFPFLRREGKRPSRNP